MPQARESRIADRFAENGEPLSAEEKRQRERLTKTLTEIDRLCERVDIEGWESTRGHALLNLAINCLSETMAEVACLREKLWRLEAKLS